MGNVEVNLAQGPSESSSIKGGSFGFEKTNESCRFKGVWKSGSNYKNISQFPADSARSIRGKDPTKLDQ